MKTKITVIALCISALVAGCSKSKKIQPAEIQLEVQVKTDAKLGQILIDKDGRTLYYFANDANGTSTCTGGCEAVWPAFMVADLTAAKIATSLNIADFKAISQVNGKQQITFKGHPLYYYSPKVNNVNTPEVAGATTGEGVNKVWFVAKPDYTVMLTNAQLIGKDGKSYLADYTEGTGKTLYFTDANGLAIYTFKNDKKNKNNFTDAAFVKNTIWPIYEQDKIVVPSILDKALFGSITVHGKKQLTYKGWPLYYFGEDNKVMGSNKGVSVPSPGTWPIAVQDLAAAAD
ncbi:COG4315 family predicted lipoprotein [Pedobacter endophyticus]|uniref:Lipoprotein with Yx(FWY)xxD motif n=1 Tax=Pedobacter endophyticus TaxID=2789740 RepID=A0A7S9KZ15_9SPHI|nr:hypothetical protein [Pedobacter endophyticus]QPH39184.1 hypothetical protein IZT61_19370 [Pedobacter endophyticus]